MSDLSVNVPDTTTQTTVNEAIPLILRRRFEALVFDWDGTAVPDRQADGTVVTGLVEQLCAQGVDVWVISGTNVDNVGRQLLARPTGPGHLYLGLDRGSSVYRVDESGIELIWRREATPAENAALDAAAEAVRSQLEQSGVVSHVISDRLNRRKVDLIPLPEWADPPKAQIGELLVAVEARLSEAGVANIAAVVEIARQAAVDAGLTDVRITSDVKHIEIGLTDKSDAARHAFADLASVGIGAGLALVLGDEFGPVGGMAGSDSLLLVPEAARAIAASVGVEPEGVPQGVMHIGGGPGMFIELLEDQLGRRCDAPDIDEDPAWTLTVPAGTSSPGSPAREALLTLGDGVLGTSGSPLVGHAHLQPHVHVAGSYIGEGPACALMPAPMWHRLAIEGGEIDAMRVLDMRAGMLRHDGSLFGKGVGALAFSSMARPGTGVLRVEIPAELVAASTPLQEPVDAPSESGVRDGRDWMRVPGADGGIAAAARERHASCRSGHVLERVASYARKGDVDSALESLDRAWEDGYERLLREHREAWAQRWSDADIVIDGDPEMQLAVRFNLFHMMGSVAGSGEAALGARGLSGNAYSGHVFWDADVFGLPFLAATHAPAARAMLEYRLRRLPAAQQHAAASGRRGARFPWESAENGCDVTPKSARDSNGCLVPIRTGQLEEHITADVPWAAAHYTAWTGDQAFADGPQRVLLVETARYWASRIRVDRFGQGHIYGVIGPDEYHEPVDDSVYTNVMARWNLRQAAHQAGDLADESECQRWLELAGALIDGYDRERGIHEEFAGFFKLRDIESASILRRPVPADYWLGRPFVSTSQIVKQADVVMLHHVLPGELRTGTLERDLDFYEPRTVHGSSLSLGVHAAVLARAGRLDDAVIALRQTAHIDLHDLTATSAGGLHMASMGSVWQALAYGFLGLRPLDTELHMDPRLPAAWNALEMNVRFRGAKVRVRVDHDELLITTPTSTKVCIGGAHIVVDGGGCRLHKVGGVWKEISP